MSQANHAVSDSEQEDPRSFKNEFMQILNTLALPMFEEFTSDARGNGFPSNLEEGCDEQGNPFGSMTFSLDRKAILGTDPSNECDMLFKGLLAEDKIEISYAYDKRPATAGAYCEKLDIQSVNQVALEDHITDFLAAAMASRRGDPIPPRKAEARALEKAAAAAAASAPPAPAAAAPIPIIWKARNK